MIRFLLVLLILMGMNGTANSAVLVFSKNGDYISKTTLAAAVASSDVVEKAITVTSALTLSDDLTIPATIAFEQKNGAIITIASGKTLTINNDVTNGKYQRFAGDGTVNIVNSHLYPEWFGVTGTADEVPINKAIQASIGGTVLLGPAYATASTINMKSLVNVRGLSGGQGGGTIITYSGTSSAVKFFGVSSATLSDMFVFTTNATSNGVEAGNGTMRCQIERLNIQLQGAQSASSTGAGILLAAGTGWSGGLSIRDSYALAYKYGIKMTGASSTTTANTWTTVDMTNVWLVGRSAGIVAGSAGIYMDAGTNGVGTYLRGGTIESFATGIEHLDGGFGGTFEMDMEGNTTNYTVGASFNGTITVPIANNFTRKGSNASANMWFKEQHLNGLYDRETYYGQRHTMYHTANGAMFGIYNGDDTYSFVDPTVKPPELRGGFMVGGGLTPEVDRNYVRVGLNHMGFSAAAPISGTWRTGDIIWNTAPASGGATQNGWRCNHSGTFSAATDSTGDTDGTTAIITGMTDTSDFDVDQYVDVSAGFATTGPYRIRAKTSTSITLDTNSNAVAANITVDTSDPTFINMGVLP